MDLAPAKVFTIPAGVPFLDALADGIVAMVAGDALALSSVTVLLPTRRSCRELRDAFLRRMGGAATLLPRMQPIGDVDEDELTLTAGEDAFDLPPGIAPLRRQLMLARAILSLEAQEGEQTPPQAVELAGELAHLLDEVQTENLGFEALEKLVPDDYAEHWRRTIRFLEILTKHWPQILKSEGAVDPAHHRDLALRALAARWEATPPPGPVLAAGSTGSIPATAALLKVIARLPQGAVILPGFDEELDDESWEALDHTHPQYAFKQLLPRMEVERAAVTWWPYGAAAAISDARRRLISVALRPPATTIGWRNLPALPPEAVACLTRIDAAHPQEEAQIIALVLREALELPGKTAALVTPDRNLARRVTAELARFGVGIDDSAGRPLAATPPANFLRLIAAAICTGAAPAPLLALLKHPLAAGGLNPAQFRHFARVLELTCLRGARPAPGLASLVDMLREAGEPRITAWFTEFLTRAEAFEQLASGTVAPDALLRAHVAFAEWLAGSDAESGSRRLWAGDAGTALATFIAELADAGRDFPPLAGSAYPSFLDECLSGRVVRPSWGGHPRLHILGPLEARLLSFDLIVLGGLNEGTWPQESPVDPWMSRPMRHAFGLPALERRIGQAAHDFAQACASRMVILTRAQRVEGTPTVPSRWLQRLDAVISAANLKDHLDAVPARRLEAWRAQLDRVESMHVATPPAPCPPVEARPRRLSVTEIETWRRDPYAIYARRVLRLAPLDPIDADPGAAERGMIIHQALDRFVHDFPQLLPADAVERLLEIGRQEFGARLASPGIWAFWWPRYEAIARWFVGHEIERRRTCLPLRTEGKGRLLIPNAGAPFTLTARVDRIDRLDDGTLAIIDYKTGRRPDIREVADAFQPQLPLEAVMAQGGGFEDVAPALVSQLRYWHLKGGDPAGEEICIDGGKDMPTPADLATEALAGLRQLIERFDDPETPYHARPYPEKALRYNAYAHLARVNEWSAEDPA